MDRTITVAIVGLGRAGWNLHLQPILSHQGFRIVAVADPLEERRQEAINLTGCEGYPNLRELLLQSNAELIVIATPSVSHYTDAKASLQSGRHVIVEKPMALLADEAEELVLLAQARSLHLAVNHSHLHRAEYYHLRQALDRGVLGPLFHLRTFWGNYARRWDWQTLVKNGGGQLNNTAPHVLSLVLPLLGDPVSEVHADLRNIKDAGDAEDHVHLLLRTELGVTADVVVSSAIEADLPRWVLCGRYGTASLVGKQLHLKYYDSAAVEPLTTLDAAAPGRKYLKETLPWQHEVLELSENPNPGFHQNVYDVIANGAQALVTPRSAAEVVRVTNLAHHDAARRQSV